MSCLPLISRSAKTYDHRLRNLVHETQDISTALDIGVPRSTAYGWLHNEPPEVVSLDVLNLNEQHLQYELTKTRKRCKRLLAIIRLLVVLIRTIGNRIDYSRIPDGHRKSKLLHVIESSKETLPLRSILKIIGMSSSRYHLWDDQQQCGNLDDNNSCPRTSPNQLTIEEISAIKDMAINRRIFANYLYKNWPGNRENWPGNSQLSGQFRVEVRRRWEIGQLNGNFRSISACSNERIVDTCPETR